MILLFVSVTCSLKPQSCYLRPDSWYYTCLQTWTLENWEGSFYRFCFFTYEERSIVRDCHNNRNIQARGGIWIEDAGGKTWCMNSAVKITCFRLQHINMSTLISKSSQILFSFQVDVSVFYVNGSSFASWNIGILLSFSVFRPLPAGHVITLSCCILAWAHMGKFRAFYEGGWQGKVKENVQSN